VPVFSVGDAIVTRVEETNLPSYPLRDIFPEFTDAHMAEHKTWLAPHHYEAETGKIKLSVHSWLLQVGGKKILIDSCCGNNKVKPGRPFWHMLNLPFLERLAAAGARPDEIDMVMCTANGYRPFPMLATSFQNRTWTISRKSMRTPKKGRPSWGPSGNASFPFSNKAALIS
jgi:hypothetical protein